MKLCAVVYHWACSVCVDVQRRTGEPAGHRGALETAAECREQEQRTKYKVIPARCFELKEVTVSVKGPSNELLPQPRL
ncbi:hypothetical protein TYRP_004721 [Tyrophagus putrescentiae]|nr:hypothetical protein TYRP_004721 [Tyrophagus putrescentiae]